VLDLGVRGEEIGTYEGEGGEEKGKGGEMHCDERVEAWWGC
jgi:hypothetical protein